MEEFVNNIFAASPQTFDQLALQQFHHQYLHNAVYRQWINNLGVNVDSIQSFHQIPFIPISFFKQFSVVTGSFDPQVIFESSGTTHTVNSRHLVKDAEVYKTSFREGFRHFYGNVSDWCIIGLLPSYLERSGSSLVMMVEELIADTAHPSSGLYLYDFTRLHKVLEALEQQQQQTLLIGVTFALIDFAEQFPMQLMHTTIMETGGMKGRKKEMIRNEVHAILIEKLGVQKIHSEYGMTELLSQAYSKGDGLFYPSPWMKVLVRDEDDPMHLRTEGRGVINVIDLANVHSCSFIATDDVGTVYPDGSFEVLGRMDNSDIRGCSLMAL